VLPWKQAICDVGWPRVTPLHRAAMQQEFLAPPAVADCTPGPLTFLFC